MSFRTGLLAMCIGMATFGPVEARDGRAVTYLPDTNIHTKNAILAFAKDLSEASGGSINLEVFTNGVLLPAKSTLSGVADGVAQMGFHTTALTPSDLPVSNLLPAMGYLNTDPYVLGAAHADWLMHESAGYDEFLRQGVVPVGGNSLPSVVFLCATPAPTTMEDLRGKRIRTLVGGLAGEISNALHFTPVGMPAPDLFMALENGQIDCAGILGTYINTDMQLHEVIDSVLLIDLPPTFTDPMHIYNVGYWRGLDDAQRQTIFDTTARTMATMAAEFEAATLANYDFAREKGIEVTGPAEDVTAAVSAWAATLPAKVTDAASGLSIENSDQLAPTYETYIRKWEGLIGGLEDRQDVDALTALFKTEIFDAVDAATYGME